MSWRTQTTRHYDSNNSTSLAARGAIHQNLLMLARMPAFSHFPHQVQYARTTLGVCIINKYELVITTYQIPLLYAYAYA